MSGNVLARIADPASSPADVASALRERQQGTRAVPDASISQSMAATVVDFRETVPLTSLARNATGIVAGVRVAAAGIDFENDPAVERMGLRLIEIGFVKGAQLRVIAFGQPGDDPIGVRIGGRGGISTFALRRLEAACVWVWPDK